MTAKKAKEEPISDEEQDMREIEEKVKRMMDPSVPDKVPDDLPKEIELEPPADGKETGPKTAPEVSKKAKNPIAISVISHDEDDHKIVVPTEPAESEAADESVSEDEQSEEMTDKPESEDEPVPETEAEPEPDEVPEQEEAVPESEDETAPTDETTVTDESAPETVEPEEPEATEPDLEDPKTADAVDDISRKESDDLLAHEDAEIAKAFTEKPPSFGARLKHGLSAWWHNPLARRTTLIVLALGVAAALFVPTSRYFVLNTAGARSGASVRILDESTRQPLKNVEVSLRGQKVMTDNEGSARFNKIKLGTTELVAEKRAFAPTRQKVTIGWGSNPLPEKSLTPVGSQYSFTVTDFLSTKPIKKVEAVSGDASAFSDDEGKIKLTIDKSDDTPLEVTLKGEGLREEKLTIKADDKTVQEIKMAPIRKHVFITKRSGRYDVYKIDVDGKNEQLVLAGTGSEREDLALVPHPGKDIVALVSTRGNVRNSDGFLMSALTVIDLSDNKPVELAKAERVQIINWIGDRLVYVRVAAGTSAANPKRHRLISYDLETEESKELASSNFFNSVTVARGAIYYAPSSAYQTGPTALYKVYGDGTRQQTVMPQETWSMYRTSYDNLTLAIGQDWYDYNLTTNSSNKLGGPPANPQARIYENNPDGQQSLWLDQRDGKGVLLAYEVSKNEDKEIFKRSGLKGPLRWLNNNAVVFRVSSDQETADYAVSLNGGEPKKIRDVTNTAGLEGWYYY